MANETQHKKWVAHGNGVFLEGSSSNILTVTPVGDKTITESITQRVVNSVNALSGLTNDEINNLPKIIDEGTVAIKQRDELLNVLEFAYKQFNRFESAHGTNDCEAAFSMKGIIESYKPKSHESTN